MLKANTIVRLLVYFFLTLTVMLLLLFAATAIPNSAVDYYQSDALKILESEGVYPSYFFETTASAQDNYTDTIIIQHIIKDESESLPVSAMHSNYTRYWHGYCVVLRPLLTTFSLYNIRFMSMIVYVVLFGTSAVLIANRVSFETAIAFLVSIAMTYPLVVMTSLQFLPVFLISFTAIVFELLFPSFMRKDCLVYFMIIGMVTSFFDFLTTPVVTLGFPLIVLLISEYKNQHNKKAEIQVLFGNSASWLFGYGLCWASKWVVASIILKKSVIDDAASQIVFRTMGNDIYPGRHISDRIDAIKENCLRMFANQGYKFMVLFMVLIVVLILLAVVNRKRDASPPVLAVIIVGVYPLMWYMLLSNHSIIHYFTYRALSVMVFAVFSALLNSIEWYSIFHNKERFPKTKLK